MRERNEWLQGQRKAPALLRVDRNAIEKVTHLPRFLGKEPVA